MGAPGRPGKTRSYLAARRSYRSPRPTWSARPAPGIPALREGPGRDHPPGPDRRRRPHRPARTRPPHPAPARRLAPRAGMAQPARHRLRPARRSGLTSPDRFAPRRPQRPPEPRPPARNPGQTAQQASGRTPAPRFTPENSSCRDRSENDLPEWVGGSRLGACCSSPMRHNSQMTSQPPCTETRFTWPGCHGQHEVCRILRNTFFKIFIPYPQVRTDIAGLQRVISVELTCIHDRFTIVDAR